MTSDISSLTESNVPSQENPDRSHRVIIRLENLSKVYGSGETIVHALSSVNLSIHRGEYCAIMGASGSGKSTIMNMIGCLDRPTSGAYYLENLDVSKLPDAELAKIRNSKIGFVFQQFHLLPQMSALENVMLPMIYGGIQSAERQERAIAALTRVGLENRLQSKPNQLSGGQQQRVAIARAMINQPILLLADEPTGALDSRTTQEVIKIFEELNNSGMTVVMVTHEPDVARHAQRIIWFKDGEIVYSHLSPEEMHEVIASS